MKCFNRYVVATLALIFSAGVVLAPPASAQSAWEDNPRDEPTKYDTPGTPDPAGTGVPDWADSGSSTGDSGWTSNGAVSGDGIVAHAPPPPNNPSRIPVDGGLGLLMVAGAGYAASKLRRTDDDSSTE